MSTVCSTVRCDDCELESQRSAEKPSLLNSVLGENLEDLHHPSDDHVELECQYSVRQSGCRKEKDTSIGTSTNCSAACGSLSTLRDLGHFGNLLGKRRIEVQERSNQLVPPWARRRRAAPRCAAGPVPVAPAAHPDRVARTRRALPRTTGRAPAGGEVVPDHGRDVQLVPLPRSWPAYVRVGLCARSIATVSRS